MSPLDEPIGLLLFAFGVGSFVGILAFAALCELVTRCRRGK